MTWAMECAQMGFVRQGWLALSVPTVKQPRKPCHHCVLATSMDALVAAESAARLGEEALVVDEASLIAADTNQGELAGLQLTGAVVLVHWASARRRPPVSWFSEVRFCSADVEAMTGSNRAGHWTAGTSTFILELSPPLWDPEHNTVMWPIRSAHGAALSVGRLTVTVGAPWEERCRGT